MDKKIKRYNFSDEDGDEIDVSIFEIEHDPDEDRLPPWCKSLDVTTIESRLLELEKENDRLRKERDAAVEWFRRAMITMEGYHDCTPCCTPFKEDEEEFFLALSSLLRGDSDA
jgi:hypothetical protein